MKVAIFGLGYVGTVSAACLAKLGHEIIGVDVSSVKVDQINAGASPIVEAGLAELISVAQSAGRLKATTNVFDAVRWADVSLICVGTPSRPNGSLDTAYAQKVISDIGSALKESTSRHTVIVRSTLLPGTTVGVLQPILEEALGRACGGNVGLAYNPEFLREGSAVKDFDEPPFTVVGGIDEASISDAAAVYDGVKAPINRVDIPEAEMIKYACNAFHAVKIVFANEIGNFAKAHGVDSHVVMDMVCQDRKLNLSSYYMKSGFAYGGSCLPKDVRAILFGARDHDISLPMLESLSHSNELQIHRAVRMVLAQKKRKVAVLGFSFKAGTDDLRESPTVEMIEALLGKGCDLRLYDKNVSWAKLMGANKAYIESVIPHISNLMVPDINEALAHAEVVVIGNNSEEFAPALQTTRDKVVIDLVRLRGLDQTWLEQMGEHYQGICW